MVEIKQMKAFHDLFHSELHSLSPKNGANLQKLQRYYSSSPIELCAALDMQSVLIRHMKRMGTIERARLALTTTPIKASEMQ